jgi:serine O-acetyltransferase
MIRMVIADYKAVFERDPAAISKLEVLLAYPGFHAIVLHRIAHRLWKWRIPWLPRLISHFNRWLTLIEIHPGAQIEKGFFIDHGAGVVIGETAVVGENVTLYQGVTLGGTGKERGKRHPTIGDNAVIATGAKILGNITIGDGVRVGANAVVIRSVPDNSTVVGVPGRVVKIDGVRVPGARLDHSDLPDPILERLENLQHEIDDIERHMKSWREQFGRDYESNQGDQSG